MRKIILIFEFLIAAGVVFLTLFFILLLNLPDHSYLAKPAQFLISAGAIMFVIGGFGLVLMSLRGSSKRFRAMDRKGNVYGVNWPGKDVSQVRNFGKWLGIIILLLYVALALFAKFKFNMDIKRFFE